jgi:hypothetical protein
MITALGVQEQTWLGEVLFYGYAEKKLEKKRIIIPSSCVHC